MKHLLIATLSLFSLTAFAVEKDPTGPSNTQLTQDLGIVAPQLAAYTRDVLFGDVWKRPGLAPRERSILTMAALVAGGNTAQMPGHFNRALDNGVKPSEIIALITHLAFYSGWPNAMSAVNVAKTVFAQRRISPDQIQAGSKVLLSTDEAVEAKRAALVQANVGAVAPDLVRYTNDVLFGDVWRDPDLTPADRSLITVAALITQGQTEQLTFHLNRAMDNGLTKSQIAEVVTQLAFYAGWPKAMSAVPVIRSVFESRDH